MLQSVDMLSVAGTALLLSVCAVIGYVIIKKTGKRIGKLRAQQPTVPMQRTNKVSAAESPNRLADPEQREFVARMLQGMAQQVQQEQGMSESRAHESCVVRLVPQIPLRERNNPLNWLGGAPSLPNTIAWPDFEGKQGVFLAQIHCADLPQDLWEGAGPRNGWLIFFIHPGKFEMRVLHTTELGVQRIALPPGESQWLKSGQGQQHDQGEEGHTRNFPLWPVDLVAVRDGKNDLRMIEGEHPVHQQYKAGYNLAHPGQQPFDWASTKLMLRLALASLNKHFSNYDPVSAASIISEKVQKQQTALDQALASGAQAERIAEMRITLGEYREGRKATAANYETAMIAIPRITQMMAEVQQLAESNIFSAEMIAPLLVELNAMPWIFKSVTPYYREGIKLTPEQREKEGVQLHRGSLTTHMPFGSSWANDFEAIRFERAKDAYCRSADALPRPIRENYESLWKKIAPREMASMGHIPFAYVHEFDEQEEVTLLELPSSDLLNWMFGDVNSLVVTITRRDLAAADFSRVKAQVSN